MPIALLILIVVNLILNSFFERMTEDDPVKNPLSFVISISWGVVMFLCIAMIARDYGY